MDFFEKLKAALAKAGTAVKNFFLAIGRTVKGWALALAGFVAGLFKKNGRDKQDRRPKDDYVILAEEDLPSGPAAPAAPAVPSRKPMVIKKAVEKSDLPKAKREKGDKKTFGQFVRSCFKPRTKSPNFILSVIVTTAKLMIVFVLAFGMAGFGAVMGVARAYVDTTPTLDVNKIEDQDLTSFIYDANGNLITEYKNIENRVWAGLDEIPKDLQNAFIAIEDSRFWTHNGIDIKRIAGAFVNNLQNNDTQGGSTITQQLIKLKLLSSEQSYKRKLQEAYLAIQLEQTYSKEQILETYLNTIHLGGSNYGVKTAARDYFGKDLSELTLRECATLAGMNQNPYYFNVRLNYYPSEGSSRTPARTDKRTDTVLLVMYQQGYITKEQYEAAKSDTLVVREKSDDTKLYDHPYFVEYAVYDVCVHLLADRKMPNTSENRALMEQEIRTKGYHIYTTMDPSIQTTLEDTLYNWENYPKLANSNHSKMLVKNGDGSVSEIIQPQAAAAVLDYHTGELKGIVGGRVAPTQQKELNRAYRSTMPVGSTIKPLAVYGPALDKGSNPATIFLNVAAKIDGWDSPKGYPSNYGGGSFTGPTTMRNGLKQSYNVVAARALLEKVGIEESANYLMNMGVDPSHISHDGSGLALGTSGLTPIEMTVGFGTIANSGVYMEPLSFTKVVDSEGNVVLDAKANQVTRQVFKPSSSFMLVDMMEDVITSGTGTTARFSGMTLAGKTGTHSDYKGVAFGGFSPYYASFVWIGHDSNESLVSNATGGRYGAPLWKAYMSKIHEGLEDKPILDGEPADYGVKRGSFCSITGLAPTSSCPTTSDYYADGAYPNRCPGHQTVSICTESNCLATEYCPADKVEQRVEVYDDDGNPIKDYTDSPCPIHVAPVTTPDPNAGGNTGGEGGNGGTAEPTPPPAE